MNEKGFTAFELVVFIAIVLVFAGLIFSPFILGAIHYSDGKRIGEVVKFSQRGFLIKNWCGEMSIGGQGQAGYLFDFGIDRNQNNQALIDQLNNLQGHKVEVTYDQRGADNLFNGCSDYLVTGVKEIK